MAKGKQYEIAFKLGATVMSSFKTGMAASQKGLKATSKQMKRVQKQSNKTQKSVNALGNGLRTLKTAAGAYVGFSALKGAMALTTTAAKAQIDAEIKLSAVMKNTKGITEANIKSVQAYAGTLQGMGIIGDEVALSGTQQLATYQFQAETLKTLMPGMNDLLAQTKGLNASQQDAVNIGNMLGKVMTGQVGALGRAGINFNKAQEKILKFGTEQEKAATLAKVLEQNVGGVNKALANSDAGSIKQMNNLYADMQEEIGKKILPMQAKFAKWFSGKLPWIQGVVLTFMDKAEIGFKNLSSKIVLLKPYASKAWQAILKGKEIVLKNINILIAIVNKYKDQFISLKNKGSEAFSKLVQKASELHQKFAPMIGNIKKLFVEGLIKTVLKVGDVLAGIASFIVDNWGFIEPVLIGVVGAFLAFKTATKVIKGVQLAMMGIKAGIGIVGGAIGFLTSPIGIVVAAIAAVIAIGYLVYSNWETIAGFFCGLWETISVAVSNFGKFLIDKFLFLYDGICKIFGRIGAFFGNVWLGIKISVRVLIQVVKNIFLNLYNKICSIFLGLGNFFNGIWLAIKSGVDFFIQGIVTVFSNLYNSICSIFLGLNNFYNNIWTGIEESVSFLVEGVKGYFVNLYDGICTVFSGIGNFFSGVFDGVVNIFKGYVNIWVNIINALIDKLNSIKVNVPEWVPKFGGQTIGFSIPKVPALAQGGIATGPTLAMIGEGNESEAVLPLSKLKNLMGGNFSEAKSNFIFSPTIYADNKSKDEIKGILMDEYDDFERKLDEYFSRKKRVEI